MKTHEYLVKITINLPPNMPSTQREALLASEHKYGRQLVEQGIIRRIWRLPGQPSNMGVWVAQSATQLHELISSLPLYPWVTTDVIALAVHPLEADTS
jgi:muconolactone D-isomerase